MLIFPDYLKGIPLFAEQVMPKIRARFPEKWPKLLPSTYRRRRSAMPDPRKSELPGLSPLPAHTVLVIIDVQNDFVAPDGALGLAANSYSLLNSREAPISAY
jgi:hypothetical protein